MHPLRPHVPAPGGRLAARTSTPALVRVALVAAMAAAALAGCKDKPGPPVAPAKAPVTQAPPPTQLPPATGRSITDTWLGKWTGPEGTWLTIENRDNGKYLITIQSLDSLATYEGTPAGYRIKFERSGQAEAIRAGTGKDTGMKYLLDKTTCLYIKEGEGFCKD